MSITASDLDDAPGCRISDLWKFFAVGHDRLAVYNLWDRYEGCQTRAVERYAIEHPEDPDVPEQLAAMRRARGFYARWGRDELGWAAYAFAAPPA